MSSWVRGRAATRLSTMGPMMYRSAMAAVATAATRTAGLEPLTLMRSCRADPVADAADGLDPHAGARELGAQPGQVHVDGVRAERVGLVVPHVLGDRAAVGHAGRAPHEGLHDADFGAGEGGPLPADPHLPRGRVELDIPDLDPGRLDGRRPALQRPDPGQQLTEVERLDQVVVPAPVQARDPVG